MIRTLVDFVVLNRKFIYMQITEQDFGAVAGEESGLSGIIFQQNRHLLI